MMIELIILIQLATGEVREHRVPMPTMRACLAGKNDQSLWWNRMPNVGVSCQISRDI